MTFDLLLQMNRTYPDTSAYGTLGVTTPIEAPKAPVAPPVSVVNPDATTTPAKLTEAGNIPLAPVVATNPQAGLVIEKTAPTTPTTETKKPESTSIEDRSVPTGKDHGPSLETQTKKWFAMSDEKWNKLSEEQKQEKLNTALLGMIDARNKDRQAKGLKEDNFGVAEQYEKYMGRVKGKKDVEGLTHTVVAMKKEDQLKAFNKSFRYENKDYRNTAEQVLASDYTKLHTDNVNGAAKIIVNNFAEQNVVLAATNAPNADVSLHKELITTFMSAENERVDLALSNQVGRFGVDKDGKIDEQMQLACFKQISTSKYESVTQNAASNIYQLSDNNKQAAGEIIKETGSQAAINSIKYTDDTKAASNSANTTEQTNSSSEKVEEIKQLIASNKTDAISGKISSLSSSEKIALIRQCPNNPSVIKAMLASNPSLEVYNEINKILIENPNLIDSEELKDKSNLCFLTSSVQSTILAQSAKRHELGLINRAYLNTNAKAEYDNLLQQQEKEQKGKLGLG